MCLKEKIMMHASFQVCKTLFSLSESVKERKEALSNFIRSVLNYGNHFIFASLSLFSHKKACLIFPLLPKFYILRSCHPN